MLNSTQYSIIFDRLPVILGGVTAHKYRRDKHLISPEFTPIEYPSITFSVISHSNKTGYRTVGSYEKWRDISNDVQINWGEPLRATISATISVESVDDSDYSAQTARDIALNMTHDLEAVLKFFKLGLNWYNDKLKFVEVLSSTELPPERSTINNHYIYSCVVDFTVDYEFKIRDPNDNIRTIIIDGEVSVYDPAIWIDALGRYQPGCYGMSMLLKEVDEVESSCSMSIIII
jgi:hypothetical protein